MKYRIQERKQNRKLWYKKAAGLFLMAALLLVPVRPMFAASQMAAAPYANLEYDYQAKVKCGTVRYISQVRYDSVKFHKNYWGKWSSSASSECGTSCISMALSYIGISRTPKQILNYGNGRTCFGYSWGGAAYSTPSFSTAYANYKNGGGTYSPPIIHLDHYSSGGHFVLVIGKIKSNTYQVLDPWSTSGATWNITIKGNKATYRKSGVKKTDTLTDVRQYYNPAAKLVLNKMAVKTIKSTAAGKMRLKWKTALIADGYQIQYSVKKDFSGSKIVKVSGSTKASRTISGLKKGKTYYVRIRCYKKTPVKTVYSSWSTKKSIKILK